MNDGLKTMAKLLWVTGGVLCLMVFIYQATPILIAALPPILLPIAGVLLLLLAFSALLIVVICTLILTVAELQDRRHFLKIRRRMRELDVKEREMYMN